jgi:protein-S-isoprenylcysteine O-methyltransferase Ste14
MVLAILLFLFSLGLYFQSTGFILWVLILVLPAWIFFLKIYEEKELEIRFGETYLEYKIRTPLLLPFSIKKRV